MTTASLVPISPAARALLPVRATTRQVTDRQLRAVRTRHPSVTRSP